jgi:hypothetical protein
VGVVGCRLVAPTRLLIHPYTDGLHGECVAVRGDVQMTLVQP